MDLTVRQNEDERRFEVDLGDSTALAAYTLDGNTIIFTHTEVPEQHEGHGIGTLLIKAGLDHARAKGLKVIPSCPFFAAYMKKHSEVQDLLDDYDKERLGRAD
ncbi:MAG: GNAT family N-acetyltransferase [Sphingomicrobium sp.]